MKPVQISQGKQRVIALVGPTSSGKSALGVWLAKRIRKDSYGAEILSAASRQIYRGLDIGTGKVTKKEMAGIHHWGLGIASPKKQYSAGDFFAYGSQALKKILQNKNVPMVVGGTGLYIDALLGRINLPDVPPNPQLRAQLEKRSAASLFAQLKKLDPGRAKTIEPHHKRRLIRAVEVAKALGRNVKRERRALGDEEEFVPGASYEV